jgi:DNA-binding SARP family transcriptional activator
VEFRILGPIEVRDGPRLLRVGGPRQMALLAFLLLHANRVVSDDRLIGELWRDADPGAALKALRVAITRLRKALDSDGDERLQTAAGGYVLRVAPGELDADVFEAGVRDGLRALDEHEPVDAAEALRGALQTWRGPPLAQVAFEEFAQSEIERLEELRLLALESRLASRPT